MPSHRARTQTIFLSPYRASTSSRYLVFPRAPAPASLSWPGQVWGSPSTRSPPPLFHLTSNSDRDKAAPACSLLASTVPRYLVTSRNQAQPTIVRPCSGPPQAPVSNLPEPRMLITIRQSLSPARHSQSGISSSTREPDPWSTSNTCPQEWAHTPVQMYQPRHRIALQPR